MTLSQSWRTCLSLSLLGVLLGLPTTHGLAQSSESENVITLLCLAGFVAAMDNAGKTPPAGMGHFTCKCFEEQVNSGETIGSAQSICQAKAASRYDI